MSGATCPTTSLAPSGRHSLRAVRPARSRTLSGLGGAVGHLLAPHAPTLRCPTADRGES